MFTHGQLIRYIGSSWICWDPSVFQLLNWRSGECAAVARASERTRETSLKYWHSNQNCILGFKLQGTCGLLDPATTGLHTISVWEHTSTVCFIGEVYTTISIKHFQASIAPNPRLRLWCETPALYTNKHDRRQWCASCSENLKGGNENSAHLADFYKQDSSARTPKLNEYFSFRRKTTKALIKGRSLFQV